MTESAGSAWDYYAQVTVLLRFVQVRASATLQL
jgi:hypothetical protein